MAAGDSAADEARKKREKAAKLQREAENWERGAEGERRVAAILDRLPPQYVVFHDLQLPAPSRANVDHLVIGPSGIWVVDAKFYSNAVTLGRGRGADTLWTARSPLRKTLQACAWEATAVSDLIGQPVEPMMCIIAPSIPRPVFEFGGIVICDPGHLPGELQTRVSSMVDVWATMAQVRRVFGVEPAVREYQAPTTPTAARPVTYGIVKPAVPAGERFKRVVRTLFRIGESPLFKIVALVIAFVIFINLLPAFSRLMGSAGEKVAERVLEDLTPTTLQRPATTTTTSTTEPATTVPPTTITPFDPPPAVNYVATCPTPGAGWVLSWVWPGEPPEGVAGYRIGTMSDDDSRLNHGIQIWSGPESAPRDIRVGDDGFTIITEYLDGDRRVLATTEEPFVPPAGDC